MPQYPSAIDLRALNGTDGFRLDGVDQNDQMGGSVAGAGDVNGDGFADLILGASSGDPGGDSDAGESYVVFGGPSGWTASFNLSDLGGANGFRLDGVDASDRSGYSVASAGDVNGDGFDDVIIGAVGADPGGDSYAGESYVVFGKASGFAAAIDLGALDGTNGFRLDGIDAYDRSGVSVASAGDLNGDGFDDLIIGARYADPSGGFSAGESYVVFGKASGWTAALSLSALDGTNGFRLDGPNANMQSGFSVASAGDVNGDGLDDLLVGAPGAGPSYSGDAYVIFGKASAWTASLDLGTLDGTSGFRLDGIDAFGSAGRSVASAGDVNGDGFDDIIIGAPFARRGGDIGTGESWVVFGKAAGWTAALDLATLDGTNGFRLEGADPRDTSAIGVASAGDWNGDGFDDLLIGAYRASPGGDQYAGESYIVFGKASGFAAVIDLYFFDAGSGVRLDGADRFDFSGRSVAGAGDVNGDGFDDVLIGAPNASADFPYSGEAYLVFGSKPGAAATREGTAIANRIHGGDFGDVLTGLGGDDTLIGHGGADLLDGGTGADAMAGGSGDDAYVVDSAGDVVAETSGQGTDEVRTTLPQYYLGAEVENLVNLGGGAFLGYGNGFANAMTGGAGVDQMIALGGADTANLGGGNDYFYAGDGDDQGTGGADIDVMIGEAGNDALAGGADQDYLFGGNDNDTLTGEAGVDVLHGEAGDDALFGGDGIDYFYAGIGADMATGGADGDILIMDAGNDTVFGDAGNDYVYAGADNDTIYGGAGVDVILGEAGNDTVDGGTDVDYVWLGTGDDTFIMDTTTPGLNVDVLNDFVPGAGSGDVLRLLNTGWTSIAQVNAAMVNTGAGYSILTLDPDTQIWLIGILPGQLVAGDVAFS